MLFWGTGTGEPEPERRVSEAESPQTAAAPQKPRSSAETKGGIGISNRNENDFAHRAVRYGAKPHKTRFPSARASLETDAPDADRQQLLFGSTCAASLRKSKASDQIYRRTAA